MHMLYLLVVYGYMIRILLVGLIHIKVPLVTRAPMVKLVNLVIRELMEILVLMVLMLTILWRLRIL
nr:MAG TPA: hypothetical protein [Caudoviricetes sp.]